GGPVRRVPRGHRGAVPPPDSPSASGGDDPVRGLPRPAPGLDSGERPRPPARRLRVLPPGEGGPLRLPPPRGSGRTARRLPRPARLREPPAPHASDDPHALPPV